MQVILCIFVKHWIHKWEKMWFVPLNMVISNCLDYDFILLHGWVTFHLYIFLYPFICQHIPKDDSISYYCNPYCNKYLCAYKYLYYVGLWVTGHVPRNDIPSLHLLFFRENSMWISAGAAPVNKPSSMYKLPLLGLPPQHWSSWVFSIVILTGVRWNLKAIQ